MSLVWIIYLIDVICGEWRGLIVLLLLSLIFGGVLKVIQLIVSSHENLGKEAEGFLRFTYKLPLKTSIIIPLTILTLSNFIPSKQTAYAMLAAYGVEEVASNEKVKELSSKSLEVLEKAMNDYLEEDKSKGKGGN